MNNTKRTKTKTVWLVQRNEHTPLDNSDNNRKLRTGIMATYFLDLGWDVVWWTSDFNHYTKNFRYKKNHLVNVTEHYNIQFLKSFGYSKNVSLSRIVCNVIVANSFKNVVKQHTSQPDLIIASLPTVELLAAVLEYAEKKSVPIYADIRDLWPDHFSTIYSGFLSVLIKGLTIPFRRLTQKTLSRVTGIIAPSDAMLNWGLNYAHRKKNKNDFEIPIAYKKPKRAFSKSECIEILDEQGKKITIKKAKLSIVFAGTLSNGFDFEPIIEAFKGKLSDKDVVAFICGNGEKLDQLKQDTVDIPAIQFLGWLPNDSLCDVIQLCDIGLLNYRDNENFRKGLPNKVGEYLAFGLCLAVSHNRSAMATLVRKADVGFTFNFSSEKFSNYVIDYLNNPTKIKKIQKRCFAYYLRYFDSDKVYPEMIKNFEKSILEEIVIDEK